MSLRATVDPVTKAVTVSADMLPNTPEQSSSVPAQVQHINDPKVRVSYDTETGAMRIEESRPQGASVPAPAQSGVMVRNAIGAPTTLSQAKPSDVIDFGGSRGDTTVQVALSLGWVVPSPAGGFMLPGAVSATAGGQQPAQEQHPKDEQAQQQDTAPVNPADVRGVPGTSATSDAVLARLQKDTPAALAGVVESIAKGDDPSAIFEDAGRQLGDQNFAANAAAMHGEFIASGQQVLRNVGVPAEHFEAFENWVRKSDPDLASTIVGDMMSHSVASLAQAGRNYMKARENALSTKLDGMGIETQRREGVLYISRDAVGLQPTPRRGDFGGERFISVSEAEKLGLLTINEA